MEKKALLGMTLDELRSVAAEMGMPAFTAGQMARWIYKSHVADISEMTNIAYAYALGGALYGGMPTAC